MALHWTGTPSLRYDLKITPVCSYIVHEQIHLAGSVLQTSKGWPTYGPVWCRLINRSVAWSPCFGTETGKETVNESDNAAMKQKLDLDCELWDVGLNGMYGLGVNPAKLSVCYMNSLDDLDRNEWEYYEHYMEYYQHYVEYYQDYMEYYEHYMEY